MKKLKIVPFILFLVIGVTSNAQYASTPWIIGVGFNAVDDGGGRFYRSDGLRSYFAFRSSWNMVPYPSRFSIEKVLGYGLSVEAIGTVNKLLPGKIIDGDINRKSAIYKAFDVSLKYEFLYLLNLKKLRLKPYVIKGYGYTDRGFSTPYSKSGGFGHNLGVGLNILISKDIGVSFQATGKFVKSCSNHLQHSITVAYKLPVKSRLSGPFSRKFSNKRRFSRKYKM